MPRQHPGRRRVPRAVRALGLGTALAIARSASASWHHALVEKQCPAYLNSPFLPARTSGGSRGNCYNSNRHAESLGVLSRTPSPASAMTMSSSDRGQGNQGTFGGGDGHQKGPPPAGGASSAGREAHAASRRAGPLKATSVLLHDEPTFFGGRQPATSRAARWFIRRAIDSRAIWYEGLKVEVEARSNREAIRGRFDTVSVEFGKMGFPTIQVTGGARFEFLGVDLLTWGLIPGPLSRLRRLLAPCEVSGTVTFTDIDLNFSPEIRNFAQKVVNNVIKPRSKTTDGKRRGSSARAKTTTASGGGDGNGVVEGGKEGREEEEQGQEQEQDQAEIVVVTRVQVHGTKLAVEGQLTGMEPYIVKNVPFRCEVSVGTSSDGHVVRFKDPSLIWQPANGQHMPLPMPPLQPFDIDLGDRARIENLIISDGMLSVGGRFVLSPVGPLKVSQRLKKSNIEHDLAETLSVIICNMLRFRRE